MSRLHGHICKFICYFAQVRVFLRIINNLKDAWGRLRLRESGALNRILENLMNSKNIDEQQNIIFRLKHFSHDQLGLSYLCHRIDFVEFLLRVIQKYLTENKVICDITEDVATCRPTSPEFKKLAKRLTETATFSSQVIMLFFYNKFRRDFCTRISLRTRHRSPLKICRHYTGLGALACHRRRHSR